MSRAPKNEPTFHLQPDSPTPWVHHDNVTIDMELAAAQRVGGILVTGYERQANAEYDHALRMAGAVDPELPMLEASAENIARVSDVIGELKAKLAGATSSDSDGRRVRRLAGTRYEGL